MEKTIQTPVGKNFKHGLVIGKFFPVHAGHIKLISCAAQFCERVTVGIFDHVRRVLPFDVRKKAIEEELYSFGNVQVVYEEDTVPIDYGDPQIWEKHMQIFTATIDRHLRTQGFSLKEKPIGAIFTADDYGDELARRFNCVNVRLPRDLSSTQFRESPIQHWRSVPKAIQARLTKRVVIVGSESTGKTTLARKLVNHFKSKSGNFSAVQWVPEFGRDYTYFKLGIIQGIAKKNGESIPGMEGIPWEEKDFIHIGNMQNKMEDEAARNTGPLLICDTDAFATAIWHERYRDYWPESMESTTEEMEERALYLLTDHIDVKFHQDGIRDGEHKREWMTRRFEEELSKRKFPFVKLTGTRQQRFGKAVSEIEKRLIWIWE